MSIDRNFNSGQLWFGVDWGTHSSKWIAIIGKTDTTLAGEIHSSTLVRIGNKLIFPHGQNIPAGDERIDALKGKLIQDPLGQSFWDADRIDTHTSLGEAVCFSFCCLLTDIFQKLAEEGVSKDSDTIIEIGFSLPNWLRGIDKKSTYAAIHFHQAAKVSCWIFEQMQGKDLPAPGKPYSITEWKECVTEARSNCRIDEMPLSDEKLTETIYSFNTFKWSYLVESCAAGLPYLRTITMSIERDSPPGLHGLGKLLVVDVGAGSTDVGYMLRTISLEKKENLFYFPPAGTFSIAGNELTQRLWEYYEQQGQRMTWAEAESRKLTDTGWADLEFVNEWEGQIRRHIKEYIKGVPDKRWLPADVPLQIVVTGGSGVVPGLKDQIKKGVYDGLLERDIPKRIIERATLIHFGLYSPPLAA